MHSHSLYFIPLYGQLYKACCTAGRVQDSLHLLMRTYFCCVPITKCIVDLENKPYSTSVATSRRGPHAENTIWTALSVELTDLSHGEKCLLLSTVVSHLPLSFFLFFSSLSLQSSKVVKCELANRGGERGGGGVQHCSTLIEPWQGSRDIDNHSSCGLCKCKKHCKF